MVEEGRKKVEKKSHNIQTYQFFIVRAIGSVIFKKTQIVVNTLCIPLGVDIHNV